MPSKSKAQQRFMGLVHSLKKGDISPSDVSKKVKKAASSMSKKSAKDFASTKHKGLPKKVKQETRVRSLIRKMVREIMSEMNEGFAGAMPKGQRAAFDSKRRKQSEVLGYKLTGKNDIKTEIDDALSETSDYKSMMGVKKKKQVEEVKIQKPKVNTLLKDLKEENRKQRKSLGLDSGE